MKVVVYGLTITSSWGNGHATTYRSLLKALAQRGHTVVFVEHDAEWYRNNRDLPRPPFCTVRLYTDWQQEAAQLMALADDADVAVIGSYAPNGIAAAQALFARARCPVLFYDIDTPITLAALRAEGRTAYLEASAIPSFAAYLSFTAGPALRELETHFGARRALAFFCSVDAELYREQPQRAEFACDLSYLGTYARDRQGKLMQLLDDAAGSLPEQSFVVAGPQYPGDVAWHGNVRRIVHLPPAEHPAFYSSSRFTLNLTRADMVQAGFSPSVRLFEASACATPILSDRWAGIEQLLTPGEEIFLVESTADVCRLLRDVSETERRHVGQRARERVLAEHTAAHRAAEFEAIVSELG